MRASFGRTAACHCFPILGDLCVSWTCLCIDIPSFVIRISVSSISLCISSTGVFFCIIFALGFVALQLSAVHKSQQSNSQITLPLPTHWSWTLRIAEHFSITSPPPLCWCIQPPPSSRKYGVRPWGVWCWFAEGEKWWGVWPNRHCVFVSWFVDPYLRTRY